MADLGELKIPVAMRAAAETIISLTDEICADLFDSSTKPHATADDLSAASGVAKSTLSAKAKQVRDLTKMDHGAVEFLRADVVEASPFIWFVQVDGLIVDARELPPQLQAQAFELGVIPYIPALGRDGTAEWVGRTERS